MARLIKPKKVRLRRAFLRKRKKITMNDLIKAQKQLFGEIPEKKRKKLIFTLCDEDILLQLNQIKVKDLDKWRDM